LKKKLSGMETSAKKIPCKRGKRRPQKKKYVLAGENTNVGGKERKGRSKKKKED